MFLKPTPEQKQLEEEIRSKIDEDKLWEHVEYLCELGEKFSGTPLSKKAAEYFIKSVEEHGVPVELYEFDAFLSFPSYDRTKDAQLKILLPKDFCVKCQSHAMSGSTTYIEAELVDLGAGDLEDYRGKDIEGKIVLVDFAALWAPERLWIAQQKGAVGQITISGNPVIHDMIVTTIWGTPTKETSKNIPKIPIVSVKNEDGSMLRELCRNSSVKVGLKVDIWKGWKKIYLPVVTIEGADDPEKYFLIHDHFCSWGDGMTDNVGGNAQFIEMAKIFWEKRNQLKRGVKIAWWPGHSQGRYAGSTWYVDNFWMDLNKNCIAQMNIDSPGVLGATQWRSSASSDLKEFNDANMKEFEEITSEVIATNSSTWVFRAGDQSFSGIGIPRLGCNPDIPEDSPHKGKTTGGGAGGWWWHTLQDTIDKGDKKMLPIPMKVNMTSVARICNSPILPYNFEPVADDYIRDLEELKKATKSVMDLTQLLKKARNLKEESKKLESHLMEITSKYMHLSEDEKLEIKNNLTKIDKYLMQITRILTPAYCTESGRFEQDPATRIPPIPKLKGLRLLATLNQDSDEARFLKTGLKRRMNQLINSLDEAIEVMKFIRHNISI